MQAFNRKAGCIVPLRRCFGKMLMNSSSMDVTLLLKEHSRGNREALEKLVPAVYEELRRLAAHYLRRERSDHTLQATALVHEAYLHLVDQRNVDWKNRNHFFGVAAHLMR